MTNKLNLDTILTQEADISTNDLLAEQDNMPTFADLSLHPLILKALTKQGYITPTPIQTGAIPHAVNGRDLLLSAQTGSGKTAAFVLPVLNKLANAAKAKPSDDDKGEFSQKSHNRHQKIMIKALILTPTRELAMQVQDNVRKYGSELKGVFSIPLVGGAPYGGQIRALQKGVQIVIATPGRLIDHMNDGRVDLSELDTLILDEADRMLDMGFSDDINHILKSTPANRQTIMSSATWDGAVGKIAESFTINPERVAIKVESAHIDESVYYCDDFGHKNRILIELLNDKDINQAVVFTATKRSTEQLSETLNEAGLKARYLHGDLPQGKRNRIIDDVKNGKCDFLIATDVAARGIDISNISHVVNYDLPRQVEDYVHRIGRCGRAGRTGVAVNLCSMDDRRQLSNINRYLKRDMKEAVVEGLEPKRVATTERADRRGKKSGSARSEGFGGRGRTQRGAGGRGFGGRNDAPRREFSRDASQTERTSNRSSSRFDKPRFEQSANRTERGESRFEHADKRVGRDVKRAPATTRGEGFGARRAFGDKTAMAHPERASRFGGRSERVDGNRADQRASAGRVHKADERRQGGFASPYKKRPNEEVFFAKRQEKKAKRQFGQVD